MLVNCVARSTLDISRDPVVTVPRPPEPGTPTDAVPEVPDPQKVRLKRFEQGFWAVTAHYGFMESPDVLDILRRCRARGLETQPGDTSFYLGRETLILKRNGQGMAEWRKFLFRFLSRNARSATDFFAIPPNRVVEIGAQIEF